MLFRSYSVPESLIGKQVEIHELAERVQIFEGHRRVTEHQKQDDGLGLKLTLPEHKRRAPPPRSLGPSPEETILRHASPKLGALVDGLRAHHGGQAIRSVRRLYRLWLDYPEALVLPAIERALEFNLLDLERIEKLILRQSGGDFFRLPLSNEDPDE